MVSYGWPEDRMGSCVATAAGGRKPGRLAVRRSRCPRAIRVGGVRVCAWLVMVLLGGGGVNAAGFVEDFSTDPIATGRWTLLEGDAGRFSYNANDRTLTAHYDSALPTARLFRSLGTTASVHGWVRFSVEFEIRSEGFYADPDGLAQIAFGLMNHATTGPDRTSMSANSYDMISLDYFPNISVEWGGPTLSPTLITSDPGTGFFDAVRFEWGSETMLDDVGESPLPLDTRLTANVDYGYPNGAGRVTLRLLSGGTALPINAVGTGNPPGTGGVDGDPTTIVTTLADDEFLVDGFALLLWNDSWTVTSSVAADVVFHRVSVEVRPPADFDRDEDADLDDFQAFQACFNGPNRLPKEACGADADFDRDGDVDTADFMTFQSCFNGPNRPARPGCM